MKQSQNPNPMNNNHQNHVYNVSATTSSNLTAGTLICNNNNNNNNNIGGIQSMYLNTPVSRYPKTSSSIQSYPDHHQMSYPEVSNYSNHYVMNNQQYDVYNGGGCGFNSNQSIADVVGKNSFEPFSSFSSSSSQINMKSNLDQFGSDFFPNDFYSSQTLKLAISDSTTTQSTTADTKLKPMIKSTNTAAKSSFYPNNCSSYEANQQQKSMITTTNYNYNNNINHSQYLPHQPTQMKSQQTNYPSAYLGDQQPQKHQLTNIISLIMRQIEAKRHLIRKVRSDQLEVKKCLIELTKELFQSILSCLNLNRSNINIHLKNSIANITDLNRNILLAYSCLIDNLQQEGIPSKSDINVMKMLVKIHSQTSPNETTNSDNVILDEFSDFEPLVPLTFSTPLSYVIETVGYDRNTDLETVPTHNNELKSLHFVLILFSSFSNFDSFINTNKSGQILIDIEYIQKFIIKLIDHVCKDDFLRTRILLSLPEIID